MFENILGQNEACLSLKTELGRGQLPGSMMFEGPPASAKLSTALELARTLSCEQHAAWNCGCLQCVRHRALVHQDILLLGPKSFREELALGASMMASAPGQSSRYFFARAARKLARRFDSSLYVNEESRLNKALPLVRSIMEGIDACLPGGLDDVRAIKEAERLLPLCARLEDQCPAMTPIFQVRAMEFWARLAPYGARKTIIIEHADRMLDASRNALLKILEEPPEHAVFVLTTTRRQAIIPTILSRVRRYRFINRTGDEAAAVLGRIFKTQDTDCGGVDAYLARFRSSSNDALSGLAAQYAAALTAAAGRVNGGFSEPPLSRLEASGRNVAEVIAAAAAATSNFGSTDESQAWTFQALIDGTGSAFSALLHDPQSGIETIRVVERYAALARDAMIRYTAYNIQPTALAERLADAFAHPQGAIEP